MKEPARKTYWRPHWAMIMYKKISLFARLARAREMGIVVILALVVVVVSIRNPAFLSGGNLYDIALDSAILAIVAVGAAIAVGMLFFATWLYLIVGGAAVGLVLWACPSLISSLKAGLALNGKKKGTT